MTPTPRSGAVAPISVATAHRPPDLDLVVPAHNEAAHLAASIERLVTFLEGIDPAVVITIVDSGSTDDTWLVASELAQRFDGVAALRAPTSGRGLALRTAWERSGAPFIGYTDADLSADLGAIAGMVDLLANGDADLVIASRLLRGAAVERGPLREVLSRGYAELLQATAAPPFTDAQCGLKILRAARCLPVLDAVVDDHWFFDTELLLRAWTSGCTIVEVPVEWTERRESTVRLAPTILADLAGLFRLTAVDPRRGRARADSALLRRAVTEGAAVVALVAAGRSRRRSAVLLGAVAVASFGHARRRPGTTPLIDIAVATATVAATGTGRVGHRAAVGARLALAMTRCAAVASWRHR